MIYKSNQDEFKSWTLPGVTSKHPKTEGAGLMISGFRTWEDGWMSITGIEKAALEVKLGRPFKYVYHWPEAVGGDGLYYSYHQFNYGKNRLGYWDGEKMIKQVDEVLLMAELRFPGHEFHFLFDWSSCHDKMPESSFNTSKFKVTPGYQFTREGVQKPFSVGDMQLECEYPNKPAEVSFAPIDPITGFGVQRVRFHAGERPHGVAADSTVNYDGLPKGQRQLVWERGLLVPGMTGTGGKLKIEELSMQYVLSTQPDVKHQKSMLVLAIEKAGHVCMMLPKFHCELNGIERVWGRSKWYTRRFCNYTFPGLDKTVPRSLSLEVISA